MLADYLQGGKAQPNFMYPSAVDNFKRQFAQLESSGGRGGVPMGIGQVSAKRQINPQNQNLSVSQEDDSVIFRMACPLLDRTSKISVVHHKRAWSSAYLSLRVLGGAQLGLIAAKPNMGPLD